MRCPHCGSTDLVIREWQVEWYDAHYFEGHVTEVKHRDTSDSGCEPECAAECHNSECLYIGVAREFKEEGDEPFSYPVVLGNPRGWRARLVRWLCQ
jgi:hypothetical protein